MREQHFGDVSVVIPHCNHGKLIRRQLDALMRQTVAPAEIIIVDDGSDPDERLEVEAAAALCPLARVILTGRNRGPAAACNTGLTEARGTYVCFPASDDEVQPSLIETAVTQLERHPQAALCFSDPALVDPDTGRVSAFSLHLADTPTYLGPEKMERALAGNFFTFTTNSIVFRRVLLGAGMPPDLGRFADNYLDYRLALTYGAVYVPEVLCHFYEYPESYSARQGRSAAAMRQLTATMLGRLEGAPDLWQRFRWAGILPEHSLRALWWLLADPRGRHYLNVPLAWRCLANSGWALVRPFAPHGLRRFLRRIATPDMAK